MPRRCYRESVAANPYADFLPLQHRSAATRDPEHTWWSWRGHDVHIARARQADAPARVLVIHGAGGHSGALWPVAALVAERGIDVAAVDLPLYGRTASPNPRAVRYDDWVRLLIDLVDAEQDARPLVLLGASIGGMLALEVAAQSARVSSVAATCLLDPGDPRARARMTRFGPAGILGKPLAGIVRGRLASTMIPMNWVADLAKMSQNEKLSRLCAADPLGGAARVPLGFLASYVRYRHTPPESMTTPLTLVHPAADAWTPMELSVRVLARVAAPTKLVVLRECGHFPIEAPGVTDLVDTVAELAASHTSR